MRTWERDDPDLGWPIAAPLDRCAEPLGVDLAAVDKAAANVEPYVRADGTKVWSLSSLSTSFAPRRSAPAVLAATSPAVAPAPLTPTTARRVLAARRSRAAPGLGNDYLLPKPDPGGRYLRRQGTALVETASVLSVVVRSGPVGTTVNGTLVARPVRTTRHTLAPMRSTRLELGRTGRSATGRTRSPGGPCRSRTSPCPAPSPGRSPRRRVPSRARRRR
jgi:hypothetical protein